MYCVLSASKSSVLLLLKITMDDRSKVFENFTEADKLEWIQTYEKMNEMGRGEGVREKMSRKIKENPVVPIGALFLLL